MNQLKVAQSQGTTRALHEHQMRDVAEVETVLKTAGVQADPEVVALVTELKGLCAGQ